MSTTHIYLKNLHFDYVLWSNELKFYKDELNLLRGHLGTVVQNNTQADILAEAERFQNQFIRQNEVIDEIAHEIHVRQDASVQFAKNNPTAIEHQYFDDKAEDHSALADKVAVFKKLYSEMKAGFMAYLSKWM